MMHWVLQTNMYSEEGWHKLVDALDRMGCRYSIHKVVPFDRVLEPEISFKIDDKIIVMGSLTLCKIARARGWAPGSFYDEHTFDFLVQYQHWAGAMMNSDAQLCRLADVPFQEQPFFIRPRGDTKSFTGQVMDWAQFEIWRQHVLTLRPEDGATVTGDTLVVVAAKKQIYKETRLFIIDGHIVTGSVYKYGTHKVYDAMVEPCVVEFAYDLCKLWVPARAFVMDVFETAKGLFVGEVNNLNSAGFYAADMNRLVGALETMYGGKND